MRIVGGMARGRPLKAKLPATVRPTTEMAREAIFSMLQARGGLDDAVVVDLYCGSGAMGIEALSRGAREAYFVDSDPACLEAARLNFEGSRLDATVHFVRATLPKWTIPVTATIVFADPPYGPLDVTALLASTSAHTVVIENDRFAQAPAGWVIGKEKRYGTTLVTLLHRSDGEVA